MALTYLEAESVSKEYYYDTMKECAYDFSAIFLKLKKMGRVVDGGRFISFPVRYQKLDRAKSVGFREQWNFGKKDTRTKGVLNWADYIGDAMITKDEKIYNAGKGEIIDLMADKLKEMQEDITDQMATDLYTQSTNENPLEALSTIVDSSSSYAGISPSDAANWASQENSTTTTLIITGQYSLNYYIARCTFKNEGPSFHLTTPDLWDKFCAIYDGARRYGDEDLLKAGFQTAAYRGKPVTADNYCPAGFWYGLNLKQFKLIRHPDYNFDINGWEDMYQNGMKGTLTNMMEFIGQLECLDRRTNFKLTALDYTK
jgi:hypothetical protein